MASRFPKVVPLWTKKKHFDRYVCISSARLLIRVFYHCSTLFCTVLPYFSVYLSSIQALLTQRTRSIHYSIPLIPVLFPLPAFLAFSILSRSFLIPTSPVITHIQNINYIVEFSALLVFHNRRSACAKYVVPDTAVR